MTDTPKTLPFLTTLDPAEMRFVDNYIPILPPGNYQISASQKLSASGTYDVETSQTRQQHFTVQGPRYALNPDEIHRQFPPPNSQGNFAQALPQIVLNHRALPWERQVFSDDATSPWLALLVFNADEILPPSVGTAVNAGVSPTGTTTLSLSDLIAPEIGTLAPNIEPSPYDDLDTLCQVIDITPDVFETIMPDQSVLKYLSTVREVNLINKAVDGMDRVPQSVKDLHLPDWTRAFSVLSAHRFPDAADAGEQAKSNIVHLVSLEGFKDYLKTTPDDIPDSISRMRMISLASWTFGCLSEPAQTFKDLMTGLEPDDDAANALNLTLPHTSSVEATEAERYATAALTAGYVPRTYKTRQGEQTFAWYRGPAVAQLPQQQTLQDTAAINSAQAVIYDEDRGIFDMSYAVAFETGRLMALSSQGFVTAVQEWQRKAHRLVDKLILRSTQANTTLDFCAELPLTDLENLLDAPDNVRATLSKLASGELAHLSQAVPNTPASNTRHNAASMATLDARAVLANPAVHALLRKRLEPELQAVSDWIGKLWLLEGLPFNTLVPDASMLPKEAIRFFYIDQNWQNTLLNGAFSVAIGSSRDHILHEIFQGTITQIARTSSASQRAKLLGLTPNEMPTGTQAGFLLRSAVVSGWPGLEIKAFRGTQEGQRKAYIHPLRLTRLSPNVMFALFPVVPDWIEIDEPREGLHFGVESGDKLYLRSIKGEATGTLIDSDTASIVAPIDAQTRILDVTQLLSLLQTALNETDPLGPADFALQMLKIPENMVFKTQSAEATDEPL